MDVSLSVVKLFSVRSIESKASGFHPTGGAGAGEYNSETKT